MKKIFQILLIVGGGLLMNSCYYDELQEKVIPELPVDPDDPNYVEIKFATQIQPIFTSSCVGCHNASRNPDLREGFARSALIPQYVTASNADASPLYIKLAGGHQNLATDKITLIKTWINQGAKNN
jgi:mono/diheme cytochrome c family protein